MATTQATGNLTAKYWAKELWADVQKEIFFEKFTGTGPDAIIQKNTALQKAAGDTVVFGLAMKLGGSGVAGDSILEGNEEAMTFYDMSVTVDQIRNAVRIAGEMNEQKVAFDMRSKAKDVLKIWLAEKIDAGFFAKLAADSDDGHVLYGGGKDAENLITDADKLTCALISGAKRKAQLANPIIRPVKVKGKEYFVMVVHPLASRDLKTDSAWLNAQYYAAERGLDNPIFSGMLGVYDGVVLHEHPAVPWTTTGASSARVAHNLFLGAQAGVWAVAKEPYWREKLFDYDNSVGFATGLIHGQAKSAYNSSDYATIQVVTGAKAD